MSGSLEKNQNQLLSDITDDIITILADLATLKADTAILKNNDTSILADLVTIETKIDAIILDLITVKADLVTVKADLTIIKADLITIKINQADMLSEIEYVEHHIHNRSRTFGKSADQSGDNWATEDRLMPFIATSGNNDYGADPGDEAKVFGSADTPFIAGQTYFDPGEIIVTNVSNDNVYIIRMIWGTGTMASAISAGQYSTKPAKFDSTNPQLTANTVVRINTPRIAAGTKVWVQILNGTDNATLNFLIDAHGYE